MSGAMTRQQVFAELAKRGVHTASLEFTGGNDEGHAESIEFLDADGNAIEPSIRVYYGADNAGTDAALSDALQEPIYEKWGSFAGDFSVCRHCIWHVADHLVELDYSESEYTPHTEVI